ncbi:MAG: response regulator [Verrucomicrobia bacterium]|nr:response regulator [Verrucomicrobiota bacterium]
MNKPTSTYRILVIDDTPSIHEDFRKILNPSTDPAESNARVQSLASAIFGKTNLPPAPIRFTVDSAMQGEEGLERVIDALTESRPYAVAFVDMRIPPGWDGLETIRHLWGADPQLQIVICTAYSDHSWSAISERLGYSDNLLILKKPFDHIEALQLAHSLSRKWQLARDNAANVRQLDELVARRTYQLSEAEERFTEAFNASPLPQAIVDLEDACFLSINTALEKQYGVSRCDLTALTPLTICPSLDASGWTGLAKHLRSGQPIDEHPFVSQNVHGQERHMRFSARAIPFTIHSCAIIVLRDVTEQLETEQKLRQSQKLEAVGQLTAGIAHDFNNLLTVIQSYTSELLLDRSDQQTRAMLEPVQTATMRAASLIRQLLIFSRKEVAHPQTLDLCTIFDGLRSLLSRLISANIAIEWDIPKQLPLIVADAGNLEQIIVNLIVNSRDAMPDGGKITVQAKPCEIINTAAQHPDATPGQYIEINVCDTGTGIPADILPRVFEPFFTTKESGKGTGLGLATVYSIVKQHGGWIQVRSQPGLGTTFTFYLPVPATPATTSTDAHTSDQTSSPHLPRNVLMVEDDPAIQNVLATLLSRRGIKYAMAPDGVAALSLWINSPAPFDLLITDIVMPNGVSGLKLASSIREQNPTLSVILMSGYSEALADPKNLEMPGNPPVFLDKPFTPQQLFAAIAEAHSPSSS